MISLQVRQLISLILMQAVVEPQKWPWRGIRRRDMISVRFSDRGVLSRPGSDTIVTIPAISIADYCRTTRVKHTGNSFRWRGRSKPKRPPQVRTAAVASWFCSDSLHFYSSVSLLFQSWVYNLCQRYKRTSRLYGTTRSKWGQTSATTSKLVTKKRIKTRTWRRKFSEQSKL